MFKMLNTSLQLDRTACAACFKASLILVLWGLWRFLQKRFLFCSHNNVNRVVLCTCFWLFCVARRTLVLGYWSSPIPIHLRVIRQLLASMYTVPCGPNLSGCCSFGVVLSLSHIRGVCHIVTFSRRKTCNLNNFINFQAWPYKWEQLVKLLFPIFTKDWL